MHTAWQQSRVDELQGRLDELEEELKNTNSSDPRRERIQRNIAKVEAGIGVERKRLNKRVEKAQEHDRYDGTKDAIYFEDLGVDQLYVDEADNYKNLAVMTPSSAAMSRAYPALVLNEWSRAQDMFMKTQMVQGNAGSVGSSGRSRRIVRSWWRGIRHRHPGGQHHRRDLDDDAVFATR